MFLPHFDVLRDLLLNKRTATWNLFVLYNKNHTTSAFYFKIFLNYSKAAADATLLLWKETFGLKFQPNAWANYWILYQNK